MKAIVVVGLGYGDEAKGSITDHLTWKYGAKTVVRYNGGAQAAHRVVTPEGREHVFAQFGSGTLAGAATFLSRYMLVDPPALRNEGTHLESMGITNPYAKMFIDKNAKIVTPYHRSANRIKEMLRGDGRHGSCGMGIGEAMEQHLCNPDLTIVVGDVASKSTLIEKLELQRQLLVGRLQGLKLPSEAGRDWELINDPTSPRDFAGVYDVVLSRTNIVPSHSMEYFIKEGPVIFEGAQGVLLDENYGFHPYTTWSTTLPDNAIRLLSEVGCSDRDRKIYGILRAYSTRHGPGPFPSEDKSLVLPDDQNVSNYWQRDFRVGWFDMVMLRYALAICSIDGLVITNLDRLAHLPMWRVCDSYDGLPAIGKPDSLEAQEKLGAALMRCRPDFRDVTPWDFLDEVEMAGVPVQITSHGKTRLNKVMRSAGE